jgi:hypothetical protein
MVAFEQILIARATNTHHLMAETLDPRGIVASTEQNQHTRKQRSH